jgi:hypothetical protein
MRGDLSRFRGGDEPRPFQVILRTKLGRDAPDVELNLFQSEGLKREAALPEGHPETGMPKRRGLVMKAGRFAGGAVARMRNPRRSKTLIYSEALRLQPLHNCCTPEPLPPRWLFPKEEATLHGAREGT